MLPDKSAKPLVLEIKPSRWLFVIQCILLVLCIVTIALVVDLRLLQEIILYAILIVYFLSLLRKPPGGYFSASAAILVCQQNNICSLEMTGANSNRTMRLELLKDSRTSAFVCLLHFAQANRRRMVIPLFPDSLNPGNYRKLRLWLAQARFAESGMAEA